MSPRGRSRQPAGWSGSLEDVQEQIYAAGLSIDPRLGAARSCAEFDELCWGAMDQAPVGEVLHDPARWIVGRDVTDDQFATRGKGLEQRSGDRLEETVTEVVEHSGAVDQVEAFSGAGPIAVEQLAKTGFAAPRRRNRSSALIDRELFLVDERDIEAGPELRRLGQQHFDLLRRTTPDAGNAEGGVARFPADQPVEVCDAVLVRYRRRLVGEADVQRSPQGCFSFPGIAVEHVHHLEVARVAERLLESATKKGGLREKRMQQVGAQSLASCVRLRVEALGQCGKVLADVLDGFLQVRPQHRRSG